MMRQIILYGISGASRAYTVLNYFCIYEEFISISTILGEARRLRMKNPDVEHVYAIDPYYGDLTRNTRQLQSSDTLNDDINVANEISIVADPFARENFHRMRYVVFMGAKWKISKVEVGYPRLILTIGGLYHESEN